MNILETLINRRVFVGNPAEKILSGFVSRMVFRRIHCRMFRLPVTLLALFLTLPLPLAAGEIDDAAKYNATSAPQASLPWMSGGIGEEARDEMRRAASSYNIHMVFSDRQGHYLADIPFTVTTHRGQELYSGVSEGPLLYLRLPPGFYQIAASIDGVWQNKRVQVSVSKKTTKVMFVSQAD